MTTIKHQQQGPIFIVGMNGSGTTMLADCLENSPALYAFPRETRMVPWLIERLDDFGDLKVTKNLQRLLDTFCGFYVVKTLLGKQKLSVADVAEPTLYGVVDAVYRRLAERRGKQRWIEKSPMNVQFMPQIIAQMPTAKFIHIYRDGRDVAQSNQRRWHKNPYLAMYRWKQVVKQGREDGKKLGSERYFEVKYEELTGAPEETMQQICAFIGIDYQPQLLQSSMPFVNSLSANRAQSKTGTIVATGQKWKEYFSTRQIADLEKIGGALLADLDYNPTNATSDHNPPAIMRNYWRTIDISTQGILALSRYGAKRNILRKLSARFFEGIRYVSIQRY